jgi:hypothetical protein
MNSINSGRPIVLTDKSAFAKDLKALVMNLTGITTDPTEGDGLFTSLRRMLVPKGTKRSGTR